MTAWLNAFLLIGYSQPVTVLIGAVALGAGIFNLRDYIKSGGEIVCEVVDADSRKSTMSRIQSLATSPLSVATVFAMIALAFIVNSIEFVCSAALPAIFTQGTDHCAARHGGVLHVHPPVCRLLHAG